jgi:hypothetical protein
MDTFLFYLSYFVAWQGMLGFAGVVLLLFDHFRGKSESEGPDLDIEKFKLWFLPVWFALTLLGFYNDAVSVPAFAQAHAIRDGEGELGFLLTYVSIFGSLVCLLYAPYKFVLAVPYVLKNRRRRRAEWSIVDDEFFGSVIEIETSVYTSMSADIAIAEGQEVAVQITYPPPGEIAQGSRDRVRDIVLSRSRDLVRAVVDREADYRAKVARRFIETRLYVEADREYDADETAANLTLRLIECDFKTEGGNEVRFDSCTLDYANKNPFGEEDVSINVAPGGELIFHESYGMLTTDEEADLNDIASDELFLPEPESDLDSAKQEVNAEEETDKPEEPKTSYL